MGCGGKAALGSLKQPDGKTSPSKVEYITIPAWGIKFPGSHEARGVVSLDLGSIKV